MHSKIFLILIWLSNSITELPNHDEDNFYSLINTHFFHQTHTISTRDGYQLKLFRVSSSKKFSGRPVLLLHGILDSSDVFFVNQKTSLGGKLVEQGFDVWALNFRGNKYSHGHRDLPESSVHYWDFSFDQMGKFDMEAAMNYIHSIKKQQISIVAHSQGATSTLIYLSLNPNRQKLVRKMIFLGPVVFMKNLKNTSSIYNLLTLKNLASFLKSFGVYKFGEMPMYKS